MELSRVNPSFWKSKKVFLTGHTGFKGGWMSLWLSQIGAKVTGFALNPNTPTNLFEVAKVKSVIETSIIGDIRDFDILEKAMIQAQPEIVIHMAAQPLVRYSYLNPIETYSTNVMGTVHLLEAVRKSSNVRATLIVTSDKCYENQEWEWGYRENEPMGGFDPYSNSKGCAELVTSAFRESYFSEKKYSIHKMGLASGRAGNVIGGGDWSADRLVPDAIKAFESNQALIIRNPLATRPWQHVLEPLSGYMVLAQHLYEKGPEFNGGWNFGPKEDDTKTVEEVINLLIEHWPSNAKWAQDLQEQPHEAHSLKLDCSKSKNRLGWVSKWDLRQTIQSISTWHESYRNGKNMLLESMSQIEDYQNTKP